MNKNIYKLYSIARKEKRMIIGLMSGTSLDGLDIALCEVKGHGLHTRIRVKKFVSIPYDKNFREAILGVFSKRNADLEQLCLLNKFIGVKHASLVNDCLKKWKIKKNDIDLIASHGQTIYHLPVHAQKNKKYGSATLQIGDGDHIAVNTGIITICDFRQKHIAAGGEGAPLAVYGDHILFSEKNKPVILLNIGGIANFSFLPARQEVSGLFSTDTGPGNTMMDAWMQKNFSGKYFDNNAALAKQGTYNKTLLTALKDHPFFKLSLPKTTGPELFNLAYLENAMRSSKTKNISVADIMATLNRFTAETICEAINRTIAKIEHCKIYVSGGGTHNPLLMDQLKKNIKGATFHSTDEKDIDPDAKEAILFALLANETVAGTAKLFGAKKMNVPVVSMGKVCFPD